MAAQNRHSVSGLIDRARAEPYRFSFFQLVRLLRLHYSHQGRLDPESRPHEDPLRFRTKLSLDFPASEVSDLWFESPKRLSPHGQPLTDIQVTFLGLVGPSGVLPRPYTETLIDRHIALRDDAAHAFLDLFSHRITALFYEAWQKYRFHIEHERKGQADFQRQLLALVGLTEHTRRYVDDVDAPESDGERLPGHMFSYFAGLLTQKPRNRLNLEALLGFSFGVPCAVKPFSGRWLHLPVAEQTRLGRRNAALGRSAVTGARVWDYQSCVRVVLAPLGLDDFLRFVPGKADYQRLISVIRFYLGAELDFEIELGLRAEDVPPGRLGADNGVALGRLGWVGQQRRYQDGQVIFRIPYEGARP